MRNFARLGVAALAAVSLLAIPVAMAAATEVDFEGKSTDKGCQDGAKVRFKLFIDHGKFEKVKNFEATGFNYPNLTPPAPGGHRTGNCIPGPAYWSLFGDNTNPAGTDTTYTLRFGKKSLDPDEFFARDRYPRDDPYYWNQVYGKVRVEKKHGKFDFHAHGDFVRAASEGGLSFGGGSTGFVDWKAHDVK